jgi:hypothetical protein
MGDVIPFPIERWRQRSDHESIAALWFAPMHYWCMTMSIMMTDRQKTEAGANREHFVLGV